MISPWKKIRYRLEWLGLFLLSRTVPLLPRPCVLALSRILGWLAFHIDYRGRATAIQNLSAVYGARHSPAAIRQIARDAYLQFARVVCDQFWTPRLNSENHTQICDYEFVDREAYEAALKSGGIWVTPHYSNFEWISTCASFHGLSFNVVAQEFANPLLTEFFKVNRESTGHTVIPQRRALIRLLKVLKRGGHAAFLPDLTVAPTKAATVIDCMGFKTCVTVLHAVLAKKTGLPVMPGIAVPREDGTYLMKSLAPLKIAPDASIQQIAQQCWDAFEPYIRENPAPWLWMYKHWRFQPEQDAGHYPAYAMRSKKFDRLLASEGE